MSFHFISSIKDEKGDSWSRDLSQAVQRRMGTERAKKSLEQTAQLGVRDFSNVTGSRQLKPIHHQLKCRRLDAEMHVDTVEGRIISLLGNKCATICCTPCHWISVDPMPTKDGAHKTIDSFFQSVSIQRVLILDSAKELTQGEFKRKADMARSHIHPMEACTPNAMLPRTESVNSSGLVDKQC